MLCRESHLHGQGYVSGWHGIPGLLATDAIWLLVKDNRDGGRRPFGRLILEFVAFCDHG